MQTNLNDVGIESHLGQCKHVNKLIHLPTLNDNSSNDQTHSGAKPQTTSSSSIAQG